MNKKFGFPGRKNNKNITQIYNKFGKSENDDKKELISSLNVEYDYNYNIFYVHNIVKDYLYSENKEKYQEYMDKTAKIIKYFSINNTSNFEKIDQKLKFKNEKLQLLDIYFVYCSRYYSITYKRIVEDNKYCDNCNFELDLCDIDNDKVSCINCGYIQYVQEINSTKIEKRKVVNIEKDLLNFISKLNEFQGLQQVNISETIMLDLDQYFKKYDIPNRDNMHAYAYLDNGKLENTSAKLMKKALKEKNYKTYYKHRLLLCKLYWGWDLPNLYEYNDKIIKYFTLTQEAHIIINQNKSCSINYEFRLYKILQLVGLSFNDADIFELPSTENIKSEHEHNWIQICKYCNIPYIATDI